MGSGAGANVKLNSPLKISEGHVEDKNGLKLEKLYEIDGNFYCELSREEFKLSSEVLKGMELYNNFSRDLEEERQVSP